MTMKLNHLPPLGLVFLTLQLAAGCASTGLGPETRNDVAGRMATAQQPISGCYAQALQRNRKLRGQMTVAFETAPGTGRFTGVTVTRSELGDPILEACVRDQIGALALAQPPKTKLAVEYPLNFTPLD
jgi:hypothetical protein